MDEKERQSAFITALTTEHFVLQTAANSTSTEAGTRASLYILSLSSSLIAMGFASRAPDIFVPFVAIVLPAVFLLGVFTSVRLVDSNLENMHFLTGIARIRSYYRTLMPGAGDYFSAERGRWPEAHGEPALRLGLLVAFFTTTASMVAFINSIVAGIGVALLAGDLWAQGQIVLSSLVGTIVAVLLMVASSLTKGGGTAYSTRSLDRPGSAPPAKGKVRKAFGTRNALRADMRCRPTCVAGLQLPPYLWHRPYGHCVQRG